MVDVTVSDGLLHIQAERREDEKTEKKGDQPERPGSS